MAPRAKITPAEAVEAAFSMEGIPKSNYDLTVKRSCAQAVFVRPGGNQKLRIAICANERSVKRIRRAIKEARA